MLNTLVIDYHFGKGVHVVKSVEHIAPLCVAVKLDGVTARIYDKFADDILKEAA